MSVPWYAYLPTCAALAPDPIAVAPEAEAVGP